VKEKTLATEFYLAMRGELGRKKQQTTDNEISGLEKQKKIKGEPQNSGVKKRTSGLLTSEGKKNLDSKTEQDIFWALRGRQKKDRVRAA